MPRYFKIPEPITFFNLVTKEPITNVNPETKIATPSTMTFREFYLNVLGNDPRLTTVKGARSLYKFEQAYETAVAGDNVMVLDEDVWELWKEMATLPKFQIQGPMGPQTQDGFLGYRGQGVLQMLPFVDALEGATTKPPEKAIEYPVTEAVPAEARS